MLPKDAAVGLRTVTLIAAALLVLDLTRREARDPGDPRPIVWSITGLLALAVAMPMRYGTDVWSYSMIGRVVAVHHESPYLHALGHFSHDPLLRFVDPPWRNGTAPYGPMFVLQSAAVAWIAGAHALLYRLAYQLMAAIVVGVTLRLLWQEQRSTAALAMFGLHPVVAGPIVNGGHNDALLALGALGAVLLLRRGRHVAAGTALAASLLIKLTAGLFIIPLCAWVLVQHGVRALGRMLAPIVLVAMPLTLLIPGLLHSARGANQGVITRTSLWNLPLRVSWFPWHGVPPERLTSSSLLIVGALVVLVTLLGAFRRDAAPGLVAGNSGWLVAAAYIVPWYSVVPLPTAALHPRSRLCTFVWFQAAAITIAWAMPNDFIARMPKVDWTIRYAVPIAIAAMFVWALLPMVTDLIRPRRTTATAMA